MSIIYEALKKVDIKGGDAPPLPRSPASPRITMRIVISLAAAGSTIVLFCTAQGIFSSPPKAETTTTPVGPPAPAVVQNTKMPEILLNGIFYSGNETYALINNKIVKTGDDVEGALVRDIQADSVELELGGTVKKYFTRLR